MGSGEVSSTTLLPLPRNQHLGVLMATHTRDSNHERYLPCRGSRTSYLGVPRCPSRLGLRENTVSIRQFFLLAPLAPPAHTRVSIPLRLPSHLQPHSRDESLQEVHRADLHLAVPAGPPSPFNVLPFINNYSPSPVTAPQRIPFCSISIAPPLPQRIPFFSISVAPPLPSGFRWIFR